MTFYRRKRRMPQVIIVSLIDIFAILLIFVIVTTTFKKAQPMVTIKLPESKSAVAAEKSDEPVVLSIKGEDIFYGTVPVKKGELKVALSTVLASPSKPAVMLDADREVSIQFAIELIEELTKAGFDKVSFLTKPK